MTRPFLQKMKLSCIPMIKEQPEKEEETIRSASQLKKMEQPSSSASRLKETENEAIMDQKMKPDIKLHGSVFSMATLQVIACLNKKDLQFQFVPVDMITNQSGNKQAYSSRKPLDDVLALEDGDFKLCKSRGITRYLVHKYEDSGTELIFSATLKLPGDGSDLVYPESKKIATLDVWLEMEARDYDPVAAILTWELAVKPSFGMVMDTGVVEKNVEYLSNLMDMYEVRLRKSKYIAGDTFSLAGLHHLPTMQHLMGTEAKKIFRSCPHVSAWCADILAGLAWLKTVEMQKKACFIGS